MAYQRPDVWDDKHNKNPYIDGPLVVQKGAFGLNVARQRKADSNPRTTQSFKAADSDQPYDIRENDTTLIPNDHPNEHLPGWNNCLIPRHIADDPAKKKYFLLKTHHFGGTAMENVPLKNKNGGFQTKELTFVYGGARDLVNPNPDVTFPAFTKIMMGVPDLDDNEYPIVTQSPARTAKFAPIQWEAWQATVGDTNRAWIYHAMTSYCKTSRAGPTDEPMKEGSAVLLDAILQNTALVIETLSKSNLVTSVDELLDLVLKLAGKTTKKNPRNSRVSKAHGQTERDTKQRIVNSMFTGSAQARVTNSVELDKCKHLQKGNSVVNYIEGSNRIQEFNDRRVMFKTTQNAPPGSKTTVIFENYGTN